MRPAALVLMLVLSITAWQMFAQPQPPGDTALAEMKRIVANASAPASQWTGPTSGPAGHPDMRVAVICEDLRNGGVLGVARGISEAAESMGWRIEIFDARGTPEGRRKAIGMALATTPNGAILLGSDANSLAPQLRPFAKHDIPLVGWHIGSSAGKQSSGNVAINVSTSPADVARIASMAAIVDSRETAGVIIFTDSNFAIAMNKANAMAALIRQCARCTLLDILDVPISGSAQAMPETTKNLLARYGTRWTHALAINDIYFDHMIPELIKAGRDIRLFSAGDGSPDAFLRIQAGTFQRGTVAEPLNLQGWQLVDELNRLLARQPVTGHVEPVHLVTPENIAFDGGPRLVFDPDNGYREIYRRIWKR